MAFAPAEMRAVGKHLEKQHKNKQGPESLARVLRCGESYTS